MGWHGHLRLNYRCEAGRTIAHDQHEGPLRVLQRLYPEGPGVCHHVLVHPPGGIVGGDKLQIDVALATNSHALLTTPGATRFYRSAGETAEQRVLVRIERGARLEWLPLETIAYSGCLALNRLSFELDREAEMIGWDVLALGLPAAGAAFEHGAYTQHLELPGVWLERGRIAASDTLLLNSPLGLAGRRVVGTMWFASGAPLSTTRRAALLDAARACIEAACGWADPAQACGDVAQACGDAAQRANDPARTRIGAATADAPAAPTSAPCQAGCTSTHEPVVVLRVLAPRVEPAMRLLTSVWQRWRALAWQLPACAPRVWRT